MQQVIVQTSPKTTRKLIVPAALVGVVIFLAAIVFLALRWPFSREAVLKDLQNASLSKVDIGAFHGRFPPPGLHSRTHHFPA
jgi:hypothetical protein